MVSRPFRPLVLVAVLCGLAACAPVQDRPQTTAPRDAYVTFLSEPPGAHVVLNGERLAGTTPLQHLAIAPGFVQVVMTLDGHHAASHQQTIEHGTAVRIDLRLSPLPQPTATTTPTFSLVSTATPDRQPSPPPTTSAPRVEPSATPTPTEARPSETPTEAPAAIVSFASEPPGATVTLNGLRIGTTPIDGLDVAAGVGRISFSLAGHETVDLERRWQPGQTDRVEVVLFPLFGSVVFEVEPAWTSLEIDGEPIVARPGEALDLLEGRRQARAFRGDDVAVAAFEVAAGTETRVALVWSRDRPDVKHFARIDAAVATLGEAKYGEDNPPRQVPVAAFWIARTEVTVAQYAECVAAGRCEPAGRGPSCNAGVAGRDRHPINCVRVADAEAYASWSSDLRGFAHRLPHCDAWEYAARLGGRYPWGDDPPEGRCNTCDQSCPFVNFRSEGSDDGWRETAPVGTLASCRGAADVFDLVGNVAEWCRADGSFQVRGGSWGHVGVFLDPAFAVRRETDDRDPTVGFRLVADFD